MTNSPDFSFTFVHCDDCTKNTWVSSASQPRRRSKPVSLCAGEGGSPFQHPQVTSLSLTRTQHDGTQAIAIARRWDRWSTHHADEGLIYGAFNIDAFFFSYPKVTKNRRLNQVFELRIFLHFLSYFRSCYPVSARWIEYRFEIIEISELDFIRFFSLTSIRYILGDVRCETYKPSWSLSVLPDILYYVLNSM